MPIRANYRHTQYACYLGYITQATVSYTHLTIGDCAVIGAGSVVTRDVPPWTVAAGNPCRVLRQITEADRDFYYRDRKFDVDDYR